MLKCLLTFCRLGIHVVLVSLLTFWKLCINCWVIYIFLSSYVAAVKLIVATIFSLCLIISWKGLLISSTFPFMFCWIALISSGLCTRQKGFKRLYTLKGGVSHYLENEGSVGWIGNLFVFDDRLSLPPSIYEPKINTEDSRMQDTSQNNSFAKCFICGSQVSELRHRNCANLDCNLLFL